MTSPRCVEKNVHPFPAFDSPQLNPIASNLRFTPPDVGYDATRATVWSVQSSYPNMSLPRRLWDERRSSEGPYTVFEGETYDRRATDIRFISHLGGSESEMTYIGHDAEGMPVWRSLSPASDTPTPGPCALCGLSECPNTILGENTYDCPFATVYEIADPYDWAVRSASTPPLQDAEPLQPCSECGCFECPNAGSGDSERVYECPFDVVYEVPERYDLGLHFEYTSWPPDLSSSPNL